MPDITYTFKADTSEVEKALHRIREASPARAYPPIRTEALTTALADVGPPAEWAWLDYLSAGDGVRVVWLQRALKANDTPSDVRVAATAALREIRRVAEERMAEAQAKPESAS